MDQQILQIVMFDDDGRFIAAAYGAVPLQECPFQQARDAEDYAACKWVMGNGSG